MFLFETNLIFSGVYINMLQRKTCDLLKSTSLPGFDVKSLSIEHSEVLILKVKNLRLKLVNDCLKWQCLWIPVL